MVSTRVLISGALLVWLAGLGILPSGATRAGASASEGSPAADYLIDLQGRLVRWDAARRIFEATAEEERSVNTLTMIDPNRLLVLAGIDDRESARRHPHGSAILYDCAGGHLRAVYETRYDGDGYAVAVDERAGVAYVLAHLRRTEGADPSRAWLHAIDLASGRLTATAELPEPPNGIAVSPRDGRIFLALVNRILTYSSRPLASSWRYRSPGVNVALRFRPGSDLLFVVRINEIALFDPVLIAGRAPAERLTLRDDATLTIGLPLQAADVVFPDENLPVLAAFGRSAPVIFVDWRAGAILGAPEAPAALRGAEMIHFMPRAAVTPDSIAFAALPAGEVVELSVPRPRIAPPAATPLPPATAAIPGAAAAEPGGSPAASVSLPEEVAAPAATAPSPEEAATPAAAPGPAVEAQAPASEPPAEPTALTRPGGRLTGRRDLVAAIVLFGPGSIVREQARAEPDAEGAWDIETPPAGVYRIVPIGAGGRPLLARPNFHTMDVPDGIGPSYDFDILGTP